MDGVGAVGSTDAMLVRAAETDTDKSITLLKKSMKGEQDMVATLLPPPSGKLDIRA